MAYARFVITFTYFMLNARSLSLQRTVVVRLFCFMGLARENSSSPFFLFSLYSKILNMTATDNSFQSSQTHSVSELENTMNSSFNVYVFVSDEIEVAFQRY